MVVLQLGRTSATPLPSFGQTAPKMQVEARLGAARDTSHLVSPGCCASQSSHPFSVFHLIHPCARACASIRRASASETTFSLRTVLIRPDLKLLSRD